MIITGPNDFVAEVHDRMPIHLMPAQFDHWLSGEMTIERNELADKLPGTLLRVSDYFFRSQTSQCNRFEH